jgi:sigma-B regulation protein RsbU (phosphoserine phosphatase)
MPGGQPGSENSRRVAVDSALVPDSSFADLNTVIRDTCNRFSRTTGWSLTFQRAEGDSADDLAERMQQDEHCYWHARVLSGFSTIGLMSIVKGREQLPEDRAKIAESPFLKSRLRRLVFPLADACDAADIVVNLLNKIATRSQVMQLSESPTSLASASPAKFDRNAQHRLDVLRFLSGYDAVALFLAEGEGLRLTAASGVAMEAIPEPTRTLGSNLIDHQAISRLEVADVFEQEPLMPAGYSRGLCVPLDRRQKGLGTLWFYSLAEETTTQSIEQAISLAGRFSGTFDDLAVTQITEDNKELRRELRLLAQIQKVSECTEPPRDRSLEYSFFSKGKSEVNGDLCEHTSLDEHRTFFAIGDACGHGLPAAVITSTVRGCLRCLVHEETAEPSLSDLLRSIGNAITTTTPTYMFMTLLVGIVDTQKNTLRYANAGHPAPLLLKADGTTELLNGNGLLLGVMKDSEYEAFQTTINAGDTLVAFSDGITEARNEQKELFQSTGVVRAIEKAIGPGITTDELVTSVLATAKEHSSDELPDDATLLVLRRRV